MLPEWKVTGCDPSPAGSCTRSAAISALLAKFSSRSWSSSSLSACLSGTLSRSTPVRKKSSSSLRNGSAVLPPGVVLSWRATSTVV